MNLVSKEYCACCVDNMGVLILSEFAGSADRLKDGALLVNPYNIEEVADAIYRAYYMDPEEQKNNMKKLRAEVRKHSVFKWVDQFMGSFMFDDNAQNPKKDSPVAPVYSHPES